MFPHSQYNELCPVALKTPLAAVYAEHLGSKNKDRPVNSYVAGCCAVTSPRKSLSESSQILLGVVHRARSGISGPQSFIVDRCGKKRVVTSAFADCPSGSRYVLGGTFAPFLRASDRPIAMACFLLFTRPPLPPLPERRVPCFLRCIALLTLFFAALPYLGISPPRMRTDLRLMANRFTTHLFKKASASLQEVSSNKR